MLRQVFRELFGILPSLDLHGLGVTEAVHETERFLRDARAHHHEIVRVIYGKGRRSPGGEGVLRQVIPHWLEHEGAELVDHYERQPDSSGMDGAVKVWLRVDSPKPLP